ncbi:hypothetical protein [Hamadaea tsunoensis]|uniref:hypothetical protein n=1 Tax=Hamadaea tsunoensis TaxID=53368 RepID=UPI0004238DE2|nr:hypothetical protein [Hamadaea tsunoensis]
MSDPVIFRRLMPATLPALTTLLTTVLTMFAYAAPAGAAAIYQSQAQVEFRLAAAGITWWSSGNCSDRGNPNCTSFQYLRTSTLDGVITLKQASGCPIMITGGTETGHGNGPGYTHWNGWKVDIARWACVSAYIRRYFADLGYIAGWGEQFRAPSGNLYTDEGSHWDILYYTCGGCGPALSVSPTATATPKPSGVARAEAAPVPEPATIQDRVDELREHADALRARWDALRVPVKEKGEPPALRGPRREATSGPAARG